MRKFSVVTLGMVATLLSILLSALGTSHAGPSAEARQEAKELWEQAVKAKGGRERLYRVRNFVASSKTRYGWNPLSDVGSGMYEESLYVLPDKWWNFFDYRPGKLGYGINVLDIEREIRWHAGPGRPVPNSPRPDIERDVFNDFKYRFRRAQFIYLLETDWVKPTLIRTRTELVGFKKVDVVETSIDSVRVDFYLERRNHLPIKIVTDSPGRRGSGRMDYTFRLADYVDVDGIRMPQSVSLGNVENKTTYQFNVDYDESVFERPPPPDIGPEAWRKPAK